MGRLMDNLGVTVVGTGSPGTSSIPELSCFTSYLFVLHSNCDVEYLSGSVVRSHSGAKIPGSFI